MFIFRSTFIGAVLLGLIHFGCGSSSNIETTTTGKLPDFFFCSHWEDLNQDGKKQTDEWIAVKDSFAYNEQVTCVAEVRGKVGTKLAFKLTGPGGQLIKELAGPVSDDIHVRSYSFEPLELYKLGGTGGYVVDWMLDGILIKRMKLTILT